MRLPLSRVFIDEMYFHCRRTVVRPMYVFSLVCQPLLFIVITYSLFRYGRGGDFTSHVVLGSGMVGFFTSIAFSSAADVVREREEGTLELLVLAPTELRFSVLAKSTANAILGLGSLGLAFACSVFLPDPIMILQPWRFTAALALLTASFVAVGLLQASGFALSAKARALQNLLEMPFLILCGAFVPVSELPPLLRPISLALAPTWGLAALRTAAAGGAREAFVRECGMVFVLTIVYFAASRWAFTIIERRARIAGTLAGV